LVSQFWCRSNGSTDSFDTEMAYVIRAFGVSAANFKSRCVSRSQRSYIDRQEQIPTNSEVEVEKFGYGRTNVPALGNPVYWHFTFHWPISAVRSTLLAPPLPKDLDR